MGQAYSRNKVVFYGVVLILVIALITLTKIAFTPESKVSTKDITPTPTPYVYKAVKTINNDCSEFRESISICENAVRSALKEYPGKVSEIKKVERNLRTGSETLFIISIDLEKELQLGDKGTMTKVKVLVSEDSTVKLYGGGL